MAARVLVCDNEAPLRALVRATLSVGDYEVVEARDGDEALELIRSTRPDVVLLDMMMPGRTGLDVLTELKQDGEASRIPVVMLTARTQASDRAAVADAGADRFLGKPFSPLELISTVEALLAGRP